jgi:AcrR family transcriptional regulator
VASLPDHLLPAAVGKDRLSREVVAGHQRDRVLDAATGVFAGRGYQATTVDHIVSASRIGVGSFYALFEGKEDCFLRLYDRIVADAAERVEAAAGPEDPWADRVLAGLRALLDLVDAEPDRARIAIVEVRTAGPAAESRYADTVARLIEALREGRSAATGGEQPPAAFEAAAVHGLAWVLHQRLAVEGPVAADQLLPDLAEFLVAPYAGAAMSDS